MWTYISEKVYFCFVCSNIFAQNSKNITQGGIKQVRIRKQKRNRASIFVLFLRMKVIFILPYRILYTNGNDFHKKHTILNFQGMTNH